MMNFCLFRLMLFLFLYSQILYLVLKSQTQTLVISCPSVTLYSTLLFVGESSQGTSLTKAWSSTWTNVQPIAVQTDNATWLF